MKRSYLILMITEVILLIILLFSSFITNIFSKISLSFILLFVFLFLIFQLGYEKDRSRLKKDIIFNIIIYSILYLLITYIIGIFIGFLRSIYDMSFLSIIKNSFPTLFLIIISELLRYQFIKKGEGNKAIYILSVIIFFLIDTLFILKTYNFQILESFVKFICVVFFPVLAKNIMLTYVTYIGGYKPSIIYRLLFDLQIFLLPIFPNLGDYVEAITGILFPAFIVMTTYGLVKKSKNEDRKIEVSNVKYTKLIFYFIIFPIFILIVSLNSNLLSYSMITIGSGSMTPSINKGDLVVVNKNQHDINIGDVIVFNHDNKLIIHRVIRKIEVSDIVYFYTKGDYNKTEDGYPISQKDIVGTASFRIPYLGYPTILLNEVLERSKTNV